MGKKRRRGSSEINMTPLLDVLFCILFIVMLTSAQNEADLKATLQQEAEVHAETVALKDAELADLTSALEKYKSLAESLELYKTEAIVASLQNEISAGRHVLIITRESGESLTIPLGSDNMTNAISRLEGVIDALLEEAAGRPIYLVFTLDRTKIYTSEYRILNERLERYQTRNKEIFYKLNDAES